MRGWYERQHPAVLMGLGKSQMPDYWWRDDETCPTNKPIRWCMDPANITWAQRVGCTLSVDDAGCTTSDGNGGHVYCCPEISLAPNPFVTTTAQAEETGIPAHGEAIDEPERREERRREETADNLSMLVSVGLPMILGLGVIGGAVYVYMKYYRNAGDSQYAE